MQNNSLWSTWTSTPTLGFLQDGAALPNNVPGIGNGSGGETTGAPGDPTATGGGNTPQKSPFGDTIFIMFALILVFMIVSTMMSARRAKKQTAEMLGGLKRGDRVLTSGGMLGTVQEVRDDAVVLRIDDVSGAKAQFAKHAIQQVVKSGKGSKPADDADAEPDEGSDD